MHWMKFDVVGSKEKRGSVISPMKSFDGLLLHPQG